MNEIIRDNGWKSRKLAFSLFSVLTIFCGALIGARWQSFQPMYETLVGGVVAVAGLYLGGTIATKWVGIKAIQTPPTPESNS
jgi:putative Mn2+ efflux pump MntP